MGQDIYTCVVAGADYSLIHGSTRKEEVKHRYNTETGAREADRTVYRWFDTILGVEKTKDEYQQFKQQLCDEGLQLFCADSGLDYVIIGKQVAGDDSSMVVPIDSDKAQKMLEEATVLLAKYNIVPEQIKLYSISVWSY